MATPVHSRPRLEQMELPLNVSASPGFSVRRVEGHIVLTPKPVEVWGSVTDAARMIRRSPRWVRMLCEAKLIEARKLPGAKMWDVNLMALQEWAESGLGSKFA